MNKFSDFSSPFSGRGSVSNALRSQEPEHLRMFGKGGRLARGAVGVMTFAPTLGLIGKFIFSVFAFGVGAITLGGLLADVSEAQCSWGNSSTITCSGSKTGEVNLKSGGFTQNRTLNLHSNFTINRSGTSSRDHGLIVGKDGAGTQLYGGAGHMTISQGGSHSDNFFITTPGIGVTLDANITGFNGNVNLTLIRGVKSTRETALKVNGREANVNVSVRNLEGRYGFALDARHSGNSNGKHMTITASRLVRSLKAQGVYAGKSTSGNLTVHLNSVSAGGVTWSQSRRDAGDIGHYGVFVIRTGGSGNTEVRATGTLSGVRAGFRGVFNNTGGGTNTISLGEVTYAGDQGSSRSRGGVRIHTKNALTFTATGTITGRSQSNSSGYNGFYLRRTDQSSGGTVKVTVSAVTAPGDGIHILDPGRSTTATTNIEVTATNHVQGTSISSSDGIFVKKAGKGDVTISAKQVTGGRDGIQVSKYDEGSLSIKVSGAVLGKCGEYTKNNALTCRAWDDAGIWTYTDDDSTNLTIEVTSAGSSKGSYGIYAGHYGEGKVSISTVGEVVGDGNDGILVHNYGGNNIDSEPVVKITAKEVESSDDAIYVKSDSRGRGGVEITVSESGSISAENHGVYVYNLDRGNVKVSLGASASVLAEDVAVGVVQSGSGNVTINASAGSTITSFSSTTVCGNLVTNGNRGVYVNNARRGGTITATISANIKAAGDGIFIVNHANTSTNISTNGTISGAEVSAHGIYVNNIGSGNVSITVSGDVAGGGRRNARTIPGGTRTNQNASFYRGERKERYICNNPSSGAICIRYRSPTTFTVPASTIPARIGYALSLNAATSGTKKSGSGSITVTINSGTISAYNRVPLLPNRADGPGGAIKNGDGNSTITFNGANTGLSGKVSLGKGQDVLVFSGTTITAGTELDGGQEAANSTHVDALTFRNGAKTTGTFLSLDPAKVTNWERINLSANTNWRILGTKTLTAANVSVSGTISLSEVAAANRAPDDRLTISGNLIGGGTIVVDINLDTGVSDTITVTGNVTGATTITFNNVTPSNSTNYTTSDITVVTVQGTVSEGAFTSTSVPISSTYSLHFRAGSKSFVVGLARLALCKTPEGGAVGSFVCSGTIDGAENMSVTGNTNLVATLNSASTTVASSGAGTIFTLRSQNGISFTQSTGGGSLLATGNATGVIDASTTGNGNIDISVEGDVYLAGSGTALKATSTGTGSITISAKNISINHSQAVAVHISGAGSSVKLDGKGSIVGAVQVKNSHSTGTVTVSAALAVNNNSGTAIYAYGKGNTVSVTTSQSTTGSATGNNAVGGIKVVNKSSGAGTIMISATGKVTANAGTGIHAENDGTGALTITAASVSATSGTPINVIGRNSGNITLNITGTVTGRNSTTLGEGIKVVDGGSGNIEINTASVTGGKHGIFIEKNNSGTTEVTISGDVEGRGTGGRDYGISVNPNASAGDITLNLSNHKVIGGYAINIYGSPSEDITITSSGEIEGKQGGIYIINNSAAFSIDLDVHTVTGSGARGINIVGGGGVTAEVTVASGGKVEAKRYGIVFDSDGTGAIEIDSRGATITASESVGLWIDHAGDGAITLSTSSVEGGRQAILISKSGAGNVTLTSTGTIESDSDQDGVLTTVTGAGNVSLTVSAVTGEKNGVFAKNVGAGTVTIVGNGAITASGTGTKDSGIYAYTNASGDAISITVNSAGSVRGKFGIYTESKSDDNITISTSGAVTGTSEDGINAKLTSGRLKIDVSGNVTGSSGKTAIDTQTNASGNTLLTIHSGTITAAGATGKAITNNAGSSTIVVHSAASVTADIALGAGVDKLTFSGGSNFSRTITIDGGEDSGTDTADDVLEINAISSLLDASKLTNWEIISFGSGTNARFDGNVTLSVEELKLLSGATLSMKDNTPGDTVTVSGKLTGGGTVEIDVNFANGEKDSLVVQGNITGTSKIKVINATPANASTIQTTVHVLTYTGTASANAFSLDGSVGARGYTFSLVHDSTNRRYTLSGTRANLLCVESTNTAGSFACAGTINVPEAMVKTGTTNIVTTLANNATVNVSTFVALYMAGGNGVSFTQAANGGTINASGDASGAVWAKTSGNGNIQMTLTGTANLTGSGSAVLAESTGTGSITITAQRIVANNNAGRGIKAEGRGAITINARAQVSGGIEVITRANAGAILITANNTVSSNNKEGIHVTRNGGGANSNITINASGAVTGSTTGIYVYDGNTNARNGTITINATGAITGTNNSGILVKIAYEGTSVSTSITTSGAISAKDTGIFIENRSPGNVTISANNTITTEDSYGIYGYFGEGTFKVNTTSAITTGWDGIVIKSKSSGGTPSMSVTANASITGSGRHGLYLYGKNTNVATAWASVAAVTGKEHGIQVKNVKTATISASGAVRGNEKDGINVIGKGATLSVKASSTVSGNATAINLLNKAGGAGSLLVDVSGAVTGTRNDGIRVINERTGSTTVTAASTVTGSTVGIFAKGDGTGTSTVLVRVSGAVSASTGTGIDAYGKGTSVEVSAANTVTGSASRTTSGSVGGIKAVNKSTGVGSLSISAGGKVTSSGGIGIHAENTGSGNTTITAGIIEAHRVGINVVKSNTGNISLNITGAITSSWTGITISSLGSGNITVNTNSVSGYYDAINISKTGTGAVSVTVSGDITGGSAEDGDSGIAINTGDDVNDVSVTLSNHDIEAGSYGVYILHDGDGKVTLTSSGDITATAYEDTTNSAAGVFVKNYGTGAEISVKDVEGRYYYGVFLKHYGSETADIKIASGGEVKGYETGLRVKSEGEGDVKITSSGHIEGEQDDGLLVFQSGDADVTITVSTVTGGEDGDGVDVKKYGSGDVTFSATGLIESISDSEEDGLSVRKNGSGNVEITSVAVEGDLNGIYARNTGTGTLTITANGDVVGNYASDKYAGIYTKTRTGGGNVSITVGSSGTASGSYGIFAETNIASNIMISTSGAVTGTSEDGIKADMTTGTLTINISANVTGANNKSAINAQTAAGGNSLITIHSGTVTASGGNAIKNGSGSSTVIIHSAASVTANISLGAGVDVLTFSGGSTFNRSITIDGGEDSGTDTSVDVLHINSISSLLDASKLTNWEKISFGTGTTGRFDGAVNLATDELSVLTGATLSLKDDAPGDTLTVAGKFAGGGKLELDVNLATGVTDALEVQGDITGVTSIVINDRTPSNVSGRQQTIRLITYTGTSTSNAFSVEGSVVSQGYSYSIELDATNRRFNLVGSRTNLLCVEDTNTAGSFACAGTINISESMVRTGATNIITTLANNATVSVSAFFALYMFGGNGVTFTQAANGGTINGTGNAVGAVKAKTTGNGNIQMTLTGTATLAGSGEVVSAESTGTGSISITTQRVTASNASGRAILADGKGSITVNANNEISGGIEVSVRGLGGTVTVSASSTVSSNKNDGIYVHRHQGNNGTSASVTINASGAVTGARHGIYVRDSNGGNSTNTGTITINATGAVTGTNSDGIRVRKYRYSSWSANVGAEITTSGAVSGKRDGINVRMLSVGDVELDINSTVTATDRDGIYVKTNGEDLTIDLSGAVSAGKHGVIVHHSSTLGGEFSITASGAITGTDGYGFVSNGDNGGPRHTVTATFAAVTGKEHAITFRNAGAITVSANGAISSEEGDGINIAGSGATINVTSSTTVSGGKSGIVLNNEGAGAGTILVNASGTVKGTNNDGINVLNNRVGATTVTAAVNVTASTSGITAKGTGSGASAVSVSAVGTVSATAGTGIYAYGKGASVTVTTSTTVEGSASRTVSGSVGGIKAVNKSSGAGTVSVSVGGKITTTGGSGIHAENEGTGGITISAGEIEAHGTGVKATNSNAGAVTLNLSGAITSSAGDGVNASSHGEDDLEVNTVAVTGKQDGIDLNKTGGGSITLTISGNIIANGDDNDQAGIAAINDGDGEDITLTLSNHSVTGAYHGMYVYNEGEGKVEITSTGTITGSEKHGIYVNQEGGAVELALHTVSGGEYGLLLKHYGSDTATITLASGGQADGGETGIYIYGKSDGDISLTVSGSIRGRNDDGLFVYHSGDATVTVSVASVKGKSDGIDLRKYGSGNVTLTATGEVESATGSEQDGIEALSSGAGNISIAVGAVTGRADGIDVRNYVGGSIGLTVTGEVVAAGVDSDDAGIYAYADEDAGNITITIGSSGSVSGRIGITAESKSSGNVTINTSGAVTGTTESGIVGEVDEGTLSITISGNVTGSSSKVAIDTKSETSGTTTLIINSGIITASGGTSIQNNDGASNVTIHSGATINEKISLGAGVDKLTFIGKAPALTIDVDGGSDSGTDSSVDILTFSGFTGSVSASKLLNWETIMVAAGTTVTFAGSQSLTSKTLTLSGGVVSLNNDSPGDALSISGNVNGSGRLSIDVNLSTGSSDVFSITGNLTGTHKLIVNDITRPNETNRATSVRVVNVSGTTSAPSLTLQNRFRSGGFAYSLEYNATQKAFFLTGERSTINCIESTTNAGNFTCRGTFSLTENILGEGSGNLVVVLDASAVVNVGASVAMNMEGAGAISFTQGSGGNSINATGTATGVVHAKTSGSGDVTINLTGTANLIASGTAILVDSTGTGAINVTTSNVTANNSNAVAINLMGSGSTITLNTQSGISGGKAGIIVKNVSSTGTVTVSTSADIASSSGTAIYAYGKGASVTVSTGGQASGNGTGIKAVNKSTGEGSLTVTTNSAVTGTTGAGIYASNSGQGALSISVGVVRGGKEGIDARNYTSGNLTINATGTVTVPDTAGSDGINALNSGAGDVFVTTVGVTGDASGVDIRNYRGGAISATFNGAIVATGSATGDAGLTLINDAQGTDIRATISGGVSVQGQHGVRGVHHGSGTFLLDAGGTIAGTREDGVNVTAGTAGTITLNLGDVTAAKRAVVVTNTGAGNVAITSTGTLKTSATVTAVTGVSVSNIGSTTLTFSAIQATSTGLYVNSPGSGSATITLKGALATTGQNAAHGIHVKAGTRAGDVAINVETGGGITGKTSGITAVSEGSSTITIVTSGNIAATDRGIHAATSERGNISLDISNDITLSNTAGVGIETSTRSGATTLVIKSGTIGGGTSIKNNDGASTITVNKGVELSGNIELGGGVDKITFNESFNSSITIDGGRDSGIDRSIDVIAIDSGSATIDVSKLLNWEVLQVGSQGTLLFEGTQTLTIAQVMLAGTLSLKNSGTNDEFTLRGDLAPHGTQNVGVLEVDVNFSTGETDTITISGDIVGNHNLTLIDVTPSDQTDRFLDEITVVTVTGSSTASSLSLTGTRFASGGYLYKLNYNDQAQTYFLTGERGTLKCGSSTEGVYSCSGTLEFPETIRTVGATAVNATLVRGATVGVTVGVAIQMTSESSITFTQETGGGALVASGASTGVVNASNTGSGNVSVTLTGTATLVGAGTGVFARSTGTGNVVVATAGVVANHASATAIRASGRGARVSVNAGVVSAGRNGIIATNSSNGGVTSVTTTGSVTVSGTGIYAFSKSGNVNVNAVAVSASVNSIVAKNDGGSGNVSIATTGVITSSGSAIQAYNYGTGSLSVLASEGVTGSGNDGINVTAGADVTSITISAGSVTGKRNAIRIENEGTGSANINVSGSIVGSDGSGIHGEIDGSGALTIIASSSVKGGRQGPAINTLTDGGTTSIALNAGASIESDNGVAISNDEGASSVTVSSGATVSGSILLGGGVDTLTFADATFGNSVLDGGSDTGADSSVDVLTINGGSFELAEDKFLNWESIVFGAQTNIRVNGVRAVSSETLTVRGTMSLQDGASNDSLAIDGDLVGGGTIKIDADFFISDSDTLTISGNVTGRTTIDVADISIDTGGQDQESISIISVSGTSTPVSFSLVNNGFTTGAYQYELEFLPSSRTYILSKKQSVGSVMLVAAPVTLLDGFAKLPSLHERRSIDSTQSNWSRVIGNSNSYGEAATGQAQYESQTTGLQAGFDFAKQTTPTGTWIYGITAQFNSVKTDIKVATTEGELSADGYGVGATATWIGLTGGYMDIQAQFNQMTIDFAVAGSGTNFIDGQDSTAMAISMELGKRHTINETMTFLTNAQISWGRADIGDVKSNGGQPILFGDDGNITARFGMRLEYNEEPYNLHILTNLYYDSLESWEATFAGTTYRDSKDPVSLELGLGGSMKLSPSASLFMQGGFRKTTDDDFEKRDSAHFTTGVRWSW